MNLFMSKLVNGILELIIVSFIPFMTWLIWRRKKVGFFDWIGLKPVQTQRKGRLVQTATPNYLRYGPSFSSFFGSAFQLV